MKEQKKAAYKKPQLIAKNNPQGSYAAGCQDKRNTDVHWCIQCDRPK